MGWLFSSRWPTRDDLVQHLRAPGRFSAGYAIIKSSVVGNHHWYLCRRESDGYVFIGLDLMSGSVRRNGGWGYKDLDESAGPCEHDCPLSFINQAGPPEGYAEEWRNRVRAFHAKRASIPEPKPGLVVKLGGVLYELLTPIGPRKGWRVLSLADGLNYRMMARQLKAALLACESSVTSIPAEGGAS